MTEVMNFFWKKAFNFPVELTVVQLHEKSNAPNLRWTIPRNNNSLASFSIKY